MGRSVSFTSIDDLGRLLSLRDGIEIAGVSFDPVTRVVAIVVEGPGVTERDTGVGVEPIGHPIERWMAQIPIRLLDGETEGERTFTPPGPTIDLDPMLRRDAALAAAGVARWIEATTPELLRAAAEALRAPERIEVAVCPECEGGLLRRSGAALVCVDCGHEQRAAG